MSLTALNFQRQKFCPLKSQEVARSSAAGWQVEGLCRKAKLKPPFEMAPQKRKSADDDFIYTLSDEDIAPLPSPQKKTKTVVKAKAGKKSSKTPQTGSVANSEEDDGDWEPDFQFFEDLDPRVVDDEADWEGWGFESAKKGISSEQRSIDVGSIIRRRKDEQKQRNDGDAATTANYDAQGTSVPSDMDINMDDDDDALAEDAFGMNVDLDVDEPEDDKNDEYAEEPASDDDSVATPVAHPSDARVIVQISDDEDAEEDPEEKARRDAFFALEETVQKANKKAGEPSSFMELHLSRAILRGLAALGFDKPTPIQAKTIPIALMGKDIVGGAVTGSGKTGAFIVPILERLFYRLNKVATTRVVVLTPTRELAMQCHAVATKLSSFTDIRIALAVGGLSLKGQEAELRRRPDIVIATPGRFIDHMRNAASFNVETIEILVLDEADRMLEDGFADELNEILTTLPKSRQTMLFSATMTSTVDRLIRVGMNRPARIMVDSQKKTVGTLKQLFVRLRPGREDKRMGYLVHLCKNLYNERVIVFFRHKKEAHRACIIFGLLDLSCAEFHGSMKQAQRIESVEAFRDGKVSYLLATDVASRGLDIRRVDTVVNYEAPQTVDAYIHRVGRTARAGRAGTAVTLAAEAERKIVKAAVKAAKANGGSVARLAISPADADQWQARIDGMEDEIEEIVQTVREERQLAQAEMQLKKGENLLEHEAEIKSRPKRTWFQTEHEKSKSKEQAKARAKEAGQDKLNVLRERMKNKDGKLSKKDKKRLDDKARRLEGTLWKGGKSRTGSNRRVQTEAGKAAKAAKAGVQKKTGQVVSKGQQSAGKRR